MVLSDSFWSAFKENSKDKIEKELENKSISLEDFYDASKSPLLLSLKMTSMSPTIFQTLYAYVEGHQDSSSASGKRLIGTNSDLDWLELSIRYESKELFQWLLEKDKVGKDRLVRLFEEALLLQDMYYANRLCDYIFFWEEESWKVAVIAAKEGKKQILLKLLDNIPEEKYEDLMNYAINSNDLNNEDIIRFLLKRMKKYPVSCLETSLRRKLTNIVNVLIDDKDSISLTVDDPVIYKLIQFKAVESIYQILIHKCKSGKDFPWQLAEVLISKVPESLSLYFDYITNEEMYPFRFLEEGGEKSVALLKKIGLQDVEILANHPIVDDYVYYKWTRYRWLYYANYVIYVAYVAFYYSYIFTLLERGPNYVIQSMRVLSGIFTCLRLILEFQQMYNLKERYLKDFSNCLEVVLFSFSLYLLSAEPGLPGQQKEIASLSVFLCLVNFVLFSRNSSVLNFGTYIVMLVEVLKTFVIVLPILIVLLISFAAGLYVPLPEYESFDLFLSSAYLMIFGETTLYLQIWENDSWAAKLLVILFLIVLPIVVLNLLIGLAVGDIENIREKAKITLYRVQMEYISSFDGFERIRLKLPEDAVLRARNRRNEARRFVGVQRGSSAKII